MSVKELTYKIKSFTGGINQSVQQSLLKNHEAVFASNIDMEKGTLKSLHKPKLLYPLTNAGGLATFYKDKNFLISFAYDGIYKLKEDGTWEKIFATWYDMMADSLNFLHKGEKALYCFGKNFTPMRYNGTDFKKLKNRLPIRNEEGNIKHYLDANGKICNTEDEVQTFLPKCNIAALHYDRIFMAGDPENPNLIYFTTNNAIEGIDTECIIAPTDENMANQYGGFLNVDDHKGSRVTGLLQVHGDLLVLLESSLYKLYGSSPDNYQFIPIFSSSGTIANHTAVAGNHQGQQVAYFLADEGLMIYDGNNVRCISDNVKDVLKSKNTEKITNSFAFYEDEKYYCAIPTTYDFPNVLIEFNSKTNAFMVYNNFFLNGILKFENKIFFSNNSGIYELFCENDTSEVTRWQGPLTDLNLKNERKLFNYVYFRGRGNGKVRFTLKTDKREKILEVELTEEEKVYRKKLKNKGREFSLKIENVDNSNIEISSLELHLESDPD